MSCATNWNCSRGASLPFDEQAYLSGQQTPVFFGSAVSNFGVEPLLDFFVEHAPAPVEQVTRTRTVLATETDLAGFVFKIQANMDPKHRDRVGFMRVCAGHYKPGDQLFHVRSGKNLRVSDALTFMASDRSSVTEALSGGYRRTQELRHDIRRRYLHGRRVTAIYRSAKFCPGVVSASAIT